MWTNPMMGNAQMPNMMGQLPKYDVIKVNGRNGAETIPMAPNSTVLLLDTSGQAIIWLVQTDGLGNRTCTPYDYKEHIEPKQADYNELLERLIRLESAINGKYAGQIEHGAEQPELKTDNGADNKRE